MMLTSSAVREVVPLSRALLAVPPRVQFREYDDVWLVNSAGATVLACPILERFETGLRIRVPVGYGVAIGQRYEVIPVRPSEAGAPSAHVGRDPGRSVSVIEVTDNPHQDDDHVEISIVFEDACEETLPSF